jgi:hypothetical protein
MLVPELQKRGFMWDDYLVPGGTYRENLYGTPGDSYLRNSHPGSRFNWKNFPNSLSKEVDNTVAE